MKFTYKIFETYVMNYTSLKTRERSSDSRIQELEVTETKITAKVKGSKIYTVIIDLKPDKVKDSSCTCPFDLGPVCKHVVNVLLEVDQIKKSESNISSEQVDGIADMADMQQYHSHEYVFEDFIFSDLTNTFILKNSLEIADDGKRGYFDLLPTSIELNQASFKDTYSFFQQLPTQATLKNNTLTLICKCLTKKKKMCEHQVQLLFNLKDRKELRVFFDADLRRKEIYAVALDYGLENEPDFETYFDLSYNGRTLDITPKIKEILPVNKKTTDFLTKNLLPIKNQITPVDTNYSNSKLIMVFGQHRYYDHIFVEFLEAKTTKDGSIKNPLNPKDPLDFIWKSEKNIDIKFYSGLVKFQNSALRNNSITDLEGLRAIVKNPLNIDAYYHNSNVSDKLTASSVVPVKLEILDADLILDVNLRNHFYEISGKLEINGKFHDLKDLKLKYTYFILIGGTMYLLGNVNYSRVIEFFRRNNQTILIHESKFEEFQQTILSNLENKIKINYSFLKPATKKQIKEYGFDQKVEKLIYLSDSDEYVMISPVVKYGNVEVPVLSRKQIYSIDSKGNPFSITRNEDLEVQFVSILLRQHPHFEEQLEQDFLYIHKQQFLEEGWFFDVFEEWKELNITILGFNELKDNKYNPYKAKVTISVASGLDWFDTSLQVRFGDQNVSLKQLQKAVKNSAKYVELGDGTLGLLPEQWVEKFSKYFRAGEVIKENIRTPKMNFSEISELYEDEVLTIEAREQLAYYQSKMSNFQEIKEIKVPESLNATLRDYQKQGLNWLNFLDEFEFGGCLADDMGLGKTIQIIAFILSQREKNRHNTNLIVVPTSLIFNWQKEVEKFAPSIKIQTIYGSDRIKNTKNFDEFEVILTSYGTLLSDIRFLKEYHFNYIFLDESQAIKNPESQRYKSVRLLQSRNKIVLTGTPIENNTFDLFGQFSFACPGLLGNKQRFTDHYSQPIDKFKDAGRAVELQKKINPFLLRRTKAQVATELPDKTEMIIYCEMGEEQRAIYDSYKQEFREFLMASSNQKSTMDTMHILAGLTKMRQICNSPSLLNDQEFYGNSSAKIDVLMEEIEAKSTEHKMIIFSQFVSMLDLIKVELENRQIPFEYLTGKTKNRQSKVEEFQTNSEVRVFLISLKAGGTGLNLTEADYVYLVDPWWNPAVENQAIDRCYRIGQKKNVVAVRLICPDTIEEKIMKLQESKKDLVNDLIKTDETILKSLSKSDLIGFFTD